MAISLDGYALASDLVAVCFGCRGAMVGGSYTVHSCLWVSQRQLVGHYGKQNADILA